MEVLGGCISDLLQTAGDNRIDEVAADAAAKVNEIASRGARG